MIRFFLEEHRLCSLLFWEKDKILKLLCEDHPGLLHADPIKAGLLHSSRTVILRINKVL